MDYAIMESSRIIAVITGGHSNAETTHENCHVVLNFIINIIGYGSELNCVLLQSI